MKRPQSILGTWSALLAWLVVGLTHAPALAGPADEDAQKAMEQGLSHLRAREYEQALRLFRRANDQAPSAALLARIGFSLQGLGRWLDAEYHLEQALDDKADPWIASNRQVIEGALADVKRKLGWLRVKGSPAGAVVKIHNVTRGNLPESEAIRLPAGREADLTVELEGFETFAKLVTVPAEETLWLEVDLKRLPQPQAAPVPAVAPPPEEVSLLAPAAPEGPSGPGSTMRKVGLSAAAVGVLVAAIGLATGAEDDGYAPGSGVAVAGGAGLAFLGALSLPLSYMLDAGSGR